MKTLLGKGERLFGEKETKKTIRQAHCKFVEEADYFMVKHILKMLDMTAYLQTEIDEDGWVCFRTVEPEEEEKADKMIDGPFYLNIDGKTIAEIKEGAIIDVRDFN